MKQWRFCFGLFILMLATPSTQAHHSYIIYDGQNYITLTGTFTRDAFRAGGHAHFFLDVTMPDGEVVTWKAESQNSTVWPEDRPEFLEIADIGEEITVTGWPFRNGTPTMFMHTMTSSKTGRQISVDNRTVPGASSFDFAEDQLNPEGAEDLPELTPDGRRVFTPEGYLTRFGTQLLEERTGKQAFDEEQLEERERQRQERQDDE